MDKANRVIVKVEMPRDLDRAMEIRCAELDTSKRQFIEAAVRALLASKGGRQ